MATRYENETGNTPMDDIAIIGLDLKFPGDATSPEDFQRCCSRINIRKAHHIQGDLGAFDAPFFSIPPAEAACMDPQQRGLLECVYRALENAGIPLSNAVGSDTSVYIGCFTREYDGVITRDPELDLRYIATGTGTAMLSNRISWFYDFHGASMTMDTACSSSLMACHLACTSLKMGESSMAIVGGANLFYNPDTCIPLTSLGFLSPDSKCYSFDHRANGYSRGEGFGILVLKRLGDAVRDRDTIRAVIRSTVANQDGRSPGITQPTKQAQVDAIQAAYRHANLDPGVTRFFEAHGTGTPVGDPIEASAIGQVFGQLRSADEPLIVGAVKSNIGHLGGAAGIAGLIKAVLVLETGIIPPNIWFEEANPKILPEWHLKFPTENTLWPTEDDAYHYLQQRNLEGQHHTSLLGDTIKLDNAESQMNGNHDHNGIHNGTSNGSSRTVNGHASSNNTANGHASSSTLAQDKLFVLSAADEEGIGRLAKVYEAHLLQKASELKDETKFLNDLSFTLSSKRSQLPYRASIVASGVDSLVEALRGKLAPVKANTKPKVAFIFTGQGAQWWAMGRELLQTPVFLESLEFASTYLREIGCSWTLTDELCRDESTTRMNDASLSQPICTALQIALVDLLATYGVFPSSVVGHSSGEIAAAYAAGAISKQGALKLAYHRGALSSALSLDEAGPTGGMLSVGLGQAEAEGYITAINRAHDQVLSVACVNSPKNVSISGHNSLLSVLKQRLDDDNVFVRKLAVPNADHSQLMEPITAEYTRLIGELLPGIYSGGSDAPVFYSSLTGKALDVSKLRSPSYWVQNLVSPVQFSKALSCLVTESNQKTKKLGVKQRGSPVTELLEIGPHGALRGPVREILAQLPDTASMTYESVLVRNKSAATTFLQTIGWLFGKGHNISFQADNGRQRQLLVDLPGYPFNHAKTYWTESRHSKGYRHRAHPRHELLGAPVPDWDRSNAIWRNWIRVNENPSVKDHRVTGATLYPAAGMLVMAIEASRQLAAPDRKVKGFRFKEVSLHMALRVPGSSHFECATQSVLSPPAWICTTFTPKRASSIRRHAVRCSSAALLATYNPWNGTGQRLPTEPTFTTHFWQLPVPHITDNSPSAPQLSCSGTIYVVRQFIYPRLSPVMPPKLMS
ncbi:polyketide synthase [Coniochaeta sp. 2T2.1]|nr:polyketide synthase [Coniochaeta sp. 2T2.1]